MLRFKDIARFAALSADGVKTGLFVLYQFPHILPIAIPISALIASFLLFQRLSKTYELTALRASGVGWASSGRTPSCSSASRRALESGPPE